jgi:hypothetical protein
LEALSVVRLSIDKTSGKDTRHREEKRLLALMREMRAAGLPT